MIDLNEVKRYGVWNCVKQEFQFGICESSRTVAHIKLIQKIGNDARKYRFEVKRIKPGHVGAHGIQEKDIK